MKLSHIVLLALFAQTAFANTPPQPQVDKKVIGYLGLGVDVISPQLRAVLPKEIPADQGLVVTSFPKNSPAAEEGLKVHDVLLAYDDKVIKDPAAFIQWIRDDEPKTDVVLKVLRHGKEKVLNIEIGSQPAKEQSKAPQSTMPQPGSMMQPQQGMTAYPVPGYSGQAPAAYPPAQMNQQQQAPAYNVVPNTQQGMPVAAPGKDFDGLAIRRIGQDIYEASIGLVDASGQKQRRAYRGNRDQIYAQVMNAQDLPIATRQQLLFAIGPRQPQQTDKFFGMPMQGFTPDRWFNGWR